MSALTVRTHHIYAEACRYDGDNAIEILGWLQSLDKKCSVILDTDRGELRTTLQVDAGNLMGDVEVGEWIVVEDLGLRVYTDPSFYAKYTTDATTYHERRNDQ